MAMKDGMGDTLSLKLCIDGSYPSIEEAGGIDVTCRGDENAVGDVVHGDNGVYKAQLVSLDPDPQLAITADGSPMDNVVTFRLMDDADAPVEGAMIMKHPDCASTGEGSHDGTTACTAAKRCTRAAPATAARASAGLAALLKGALDLGTTVRTRYEGTGFVIANAAANYTIMIVPAHDRVRLGAQAFEERGDQGSTRLRA